MSSVSPILVNVSSSICLRMSAGSTNRSELGAGMRSRASAARLVPSARIGWTVTTASAGMAVAGVDREHGAALTIRTDGLEQPGHRGGGVGLPAAVRIRLRLVPWASFPWALRSRPT